MESRRREWVHRASWILAATVMGAVLGISLTPGRGYEHKFLRGARALNLPLTPPESKNERIISQQAFLLQDSIDQVAQNIREEMPNAFERRHDGDQDTVFIVPRHEGGRIRYTNPPAETIAVVPGPDGKGSVIEVRAYARPNPLEGLLTKLRRSLRI
jgi:hypothetical protein